MPRIGLVLAAITATTSYALAGCSALVFDRSSREPSLASPQTLQFESVPSGADVRTGQGQTCQTPCSLALPVQSQSVTFAKNGFLPQTVAITVDQPPAEHSFFSTTPPPTLTPNPVKVALLVAQPPQPVLQVIPQQAPPPVRRVPPSRETIPWFPS
jgi:PEGA domain